MKVASINNNYNHAKNQSFQGPSETLIKFWQMVDNGGRAAQFTVEDMCGTNFPRTYKGAMAGYKYTKKINILALLQEATREFLTGPTMCLMPVFILRNTKKLIGRTSETHIENIKNLSYILENTTLTSKENFDNDFLKNVVSDALKKTTGKEDIASADIESLTKSIIEYKGKMSATENKKAAQNLISDIKDIINNGIVAKIKDKIQIKKDRKHNKELLGKVEEKFQEIIKRNKENYKDTDFAVVKYSISKDKIGATSFSDYVGYAANYAEDFSKKCLNKDSFKGLTSEVVNNFKNSMVGKRTAVIAAMIGITGFAMSFVPKLYTLVSGNVNPNAKDIYNEADKKNKGVKA